jgi:annexin A7/11
MGLSDGGLLACDRWEAVKQAYQRKYGKSLKSRVKGETTGDYEKVLLGVIGA